MIAKAQAVLARAKPTHTIETARLTLQTVKRIHIQREDTKKAQELEEACARLVETVNVIEEELKK